MVKLVTVTWSFDDERDIRDTFLYESFIKKNDQRNLYHVHFNRNNYKELEVEFSSRFGKQHDYILYKIFLLRDMIQNIDSEYIIFCDANDTVCLGDITQINPIQDYVLLSAEANKWPPTLGIEYSANDIENKHFLNSGLIFSSKILYLELLNSMIDKILPMNKNSFGGDQGVFAYHYLTKSNPTIVLDKENTLFLSTFSRDFKQFVDYEFPMFVHDNGWNWGSPRFIEKFKLGKI
jgi:hypothetical protein